MPIEELFNDFAELVGRTLPRRWIGRAEVVEKRPSRRPIRASREISPADPVSTNGPAESARTDQPRGMDDSEH